MTALLATIALVVGPAHSQHDGCQTIRCHRRVARRAEIRMKRARVRPWSAKLDRIAACESGGRWFLFNGNGYSGGLQFVPSTWRSLGGRGLPHENSELEQKYRAVLLHDRIGTWGTTAGWPVCGYR